MWWLVAIVGYVPPSADWVTAARPRECQRAEFAARAQQSSLWGASRQPRRLAYCERLAVGYSSLNGHPSRALQQAERAFKLFPQGESSRWLAGQALLSLGRYAEAEAAFDAGFKLYAKGPSSPAQLQDAARSMLLAGRYAEAWKLYQRLVSQAHFLGSASRRQAARIEAGVAAMYANEPELALNYLNEEANASSTVGFSVYFVAGRALALSRLGEAAEARKAIEGLMGASIIERHLAALEGGSKGMPRTFPMIPQYELHALLALLAQTDEEAQEHWRAYLEKSGAAGSLRAHAEARLAGSEP